MLNDGIFHKCSQPEKREASLQQSNVKHPVWDIAVEEKEARLWCDRDLTRAMTFTHTDPLLKINYMQLLRDVYHLLRDVP